MQEEPVQEATNRAQSLQDTRASQSLQSSSIVKCPIASKRSEWLQFDDDGFNIIQVTASGDSDSQLQTIAAIIFRYTSERLGQVGKGKNKSTPYCKKHRARYITCLRSFVWSLWRKRAAFIDKSRPSVSANNYSGTSTVEGLIAQLKRLITTSRTPWAITWESKNWNPTKLSSALSPQQQPERTTPEGAWGDHQCSSLGIDSRPLALGFS